MPTVTQGKKRALATLGNRLSEAFPSLLHIADKENPLPEMVRIFKVVNVIYQDMTDIEQSQIGLRLVGRLLATGS